MFQKGTWPAGVLQFEIDGSAVDMQLLRCICTEVIIFSGGLWTQHIYCWAVYEKQERENSAVAGETCYTRMDQRSAHRLMDEPSALNVCW